MAELSIEQATFLENPFLGIVTTLRPDGSPHATPVWVDYEWGFVRFNTVRARAKERHLMNDARVAITVVDPRNPYRWLSVSGRAELENDEGNAHVESLAAKYLGGEAPPFQPVRADRVIVRIRPEQVDSLGIEEPAGGPSDAH